LFKKILLIFIFLLVQVCFSYAAIADMNDPLQSRINSGIVAKLFPQAESLGAPTGNPPYIPVFGTDDNNSVDVNILHSWRQEFYKLMRESLQKKKKKKKLHLFKRKVKKKP